MLLAQIKAGILILAKLLSIFLNADHYSKNPFKIIPRHWYHADANIQPTPLLSMAPYPGQFNITTIGWLKRLKRIILQRY